MRLAIIFLIIGLSAYARLRVIERLRIEESLKESEEKLRSMTDAAMDAIVMIDPEARVIHWNAAAERIFGYQNAEALGASLPGLIVPQRYHARLIKAFDAFRHTGKGPILDKTVEMTAKKKDGTEFPVEHTISPLRLKDRWCAVGVIKDITDRKRATEELRELSARNSAMLDAVPDIIMEVDSNKVYTWANKAGHEFFGSDVTGKEASYYFEGEQETYGAVKPLFKGSDEVIYIESWQRRKDGEKRLLAWWCRALKDADGNVTGALSSARDVTETRQAEEEITRIFNLSPDLMCIATSTARP
jgi:PAS domain S-box-containing protein